MGNKKGVNPELSWSLLLLSLWAGRDPRWVTSGVVWSRTTMLKCPFPETADQCAPQNNPASVRAHVLPCHLNISPDPVALAPFGLLSRNPLSHLECEQTQRYFTGTLTWSPTSAPSLSQDFPIFSPTHPSCHQFLLTSCFCIAFLSVEWMSLISLFSLNASTYSSRQHKGQCLRQPSLGFLGCTSTTSNHMCLIIYYSPSIGFVSVPRCQFLCSVSHFLTQWLSILSGI